MLFQELCVARKVDAQCWSGHSAAVHFAYPRVLWGSESHLRRRARPGQQVELKQTRSGIVDEIFDACPRRADLRPRAGKSVQTKPAFACGKNDARGEFAGITHAVDAVPAV